MKLINDMLNHESQVRFKQEDVKNIKLKEYKEILENKMSTICDSSYGIEEINLVMSLINAVIEQNKEQANQLENIHYDLLLQWITKHQQENIVSIMIGKVIVPFLMNKISLEKLNTYNERTQDSIVKQLLLRYENNSIIQIFIDNGLKIETIEGLNPYYFNLLNGKSANMLVQILHHNNITLPKGYWSYVFEKMANNKIDKVKDYLLFLPDKEFIINEDKQESVWNIIINTQHYDLIKYVPEQFYKPHKFNDKSIFNIMVQKKDYTLIKHIGNKFAKLLDSDEQLSDVFSMLMTNKDGRKLLIKDFLSDIIEQAEKSIHNNNDIYKALKKEWENVLSYNKINQLIIIKKLIIGEMKKKDEIQTIEDEEKISLSLLDINIVIKLYKTRKDFSEATRNQILGYLNFIGDFALNIPKQENEYYEKYKQFIEKITVLSQYEKINHNQKIFEEVLLNTQSIDFSLFAQEAFDIIKEYKLPDMSKVHEKIADFYPKQLDIFSQDNESVDMITKVFLNQQETKEAIEKIEKLAGATELEAKISASTTMADLKKISKYPRIIPKEIHINTFLSVMSNSIISLDLNTDKELLTDADKNKVVDEVLKELNTPKVEVKEEVKEAVKEEEVVHVEENKEKVINIDLFSDDDFKKFKNENKDTNNEVIANFLKKNSSYVGFQKKTLAKASVLLENINNLYETFPHFEVVIKHIENFMVLQDKGDKSFYIPPLLLGGGPGVGKTFFCSTISKLVNTHFELLNMESMTANFILTGSSAQWKDATPGKIFKSLFDKEKPNMNPIFLLDELEKAGGHSSYGVMNSLLPLLERYTAKKFRDECIGLEIDASYINWFATANDLDKLTAPIKSRFDIFNIPNPTPEQRKALIKGIYKTVRENNSWGQYFSEVLPNDSLEVLSNLMAPGAARDLRKSITTACSKAIREESNIILPHHIERYDNGETMPWDIIG